MFAGAKRGYAVAGTGPNMGGGYGTLVEYLVLVIDTICGHYLRAGERVRNPGTLLPTIPAIAQAAPPIPAFGYGERIRTRDHLGETLAGPPTAALPEEILTPGDGKVRVLFVLGGNPASAWPDQLTSIAALRELDLLVTIDPEMTLTAQLAHYVVAPTTSLEMAGFTQLADMLLFYGNGVCGFEDAAAQYSPAITTRPDGSDLLEDWEVFYGIAQRMRLPLSLKAGAHFVPGSPAPVELDMARQPTTDELMDILAGGSRIPLDQIRAVEGQQMYRSEVVVAAKSPGWEFRLDVGNADMMRDLSATAVSESAEDPEHRYRLIVRRLPHVVNSAHNIDATNRGRPFNIAHLHPDDLTDLGLRADDVAEIRSTRAAIHAVVAADATLRRGLISLPHCFGAMPGSDEDPRVDGGSAGRLLSIDEIYDRYSGQPLMSNIPVSISKVS
jgi:anaerobic selenocysteine-containing dehydrogenase